MTSFRADAGIIGPHEGAQFGEAMGDQLGRILVIEKAPIDHVAVLVELDDDLGEAIVLNSVAKFPARIKCATLAWKALERAIIQDKKEKGEEQAESPHEGEIV